uniref:Putative bax-mediated apoptosis inhibitor tegt/bi-1 n=1 Tax=Tabanus bromius TaxID=304241 RepID=A0A0K8TQA6_TABBR
MATAFTNFARNLSNKYEPEVRYHLARVYTCLTATTACATIGALLHVTGWLEAGILTALGSLGLLLALFFIRDDGKNLPLRLSLLLGFGFCSGQTLGPLLDIVMHINPQIIVTALTGTCLVFVSFTISALLAKRGNFLFLGGVLMSVLSMMALTTLVNIFVRSYFVEQTHLYIGLGVMSAFILYDTQAIVEKCRMGSRDYIQHSLDLFFDLISIFRRLLIILAQKEERDRNRRKNN